MKMMMIYDENVVCVMIDECVRLKKNNNNKLLSKII